MRFLARMFIITTIVVAVTDLVIYVRIRDHPEDITLTNAILWILITLVPIAINFWFHGRYDKDHP